MRPWLFSEPTALLLWEWGKTLILCSLYGGLAAVVQSGLRMYLHQC